MLACPGRLLLFFNGAPNIPNIDTDLLLQTKRSQMRAPRFAGGLRKKYAGRWSRKSTQEQEVCTGTEHLAAAAVFLVVGLEVVMRVFLGYRLQLDPIRVQGFYSTSRSSGKIKWLQFRLQLSSCTPNTE